MQLITSGYADRVQTRTKRRVRLGCWVVLVACALPEVAGAQPRVLPTRPGQNPQPGSTTNEICVGNLCGTPPSAAPTPATPTPATPTPATPSPAAPTPAAPLAEAPGFVTGVCPVGQTCGVPTPQPSVTLRPIDRATVRIVALRGWTEGRDSTQSLILSPLAGHGTGVLVSPNGAILTARHVVDGAGVIAVFLPGETTARPCRVVFLHPDRDIAFLSIAGANFPSAQIPATLPQLIASQSVSASGYPLEVRERFPAASVGVLSRVTNDGRLELAIALNPGNSGGPIVDSEGRLIGIVSQGADPTRGAQGITLAEPISLAGPIMTATVAPSMQSTPHLQDPTSESEAANLIASMVTEGSGMLSYADSERVEQDLGARGPVLALFAAYAWNRAQRGVATPEEQAQWFGFAERLLTRATATPAMAQSPNYQGLFRLQQCLQNSRCRASTQLRFAQPPPETGGNIFGTTFGVGQMGGLGLQGAARAPKTDDDYIALWRAGLGFVTVIDEVTGGPNGYGASTFLYGAPLALGDEVFRFRLSIGGDGAIGSWRDRLMVALTAHAGVSFSLGPPELHVTVGGGWAPGVVIAENRTQVTASGYKVFAGLHFDWIGVDVAFREISRDANSPYRALETSVAFVW